MGRPRGIIRRVAEEIGLDQATIRRAIVAAGRDPRSITFDDAKTLAEAIADSGRVLGHATLGRGEGGTTDHNALASAKAEAEKHRAERLRLMNEKTRGELIDRSAVTETVTRMLGDLRVALLALSARLAPRLVGLVDQKAVARLIDSEMRDTLMSITADAILQAVDDEALS